MQGFPINLSRLNAIIKVVLMGELVIFKPVTRMNSGDNEDTASAINQVKTPLTGRFCFVHMTCPGSHVIQQKAYECVGTRARF